MSVYKAKGIGRTAGYIILLLLLAVSVVFAYRLTNGFTDSFKTFYVQQGGSVLPATVDGYPIAYGEEMRFDVKYTFSFADKQQTGFTVKIVPNAGNDFEFTVDGAYYDYCAIPDLTSFFDLTQYDGYFTLYMDSTDSLQSILSKAYPGQTVVIPGDLQPGDYFTLVVTSFNGKSNVIINFNPYFTVDSMALDSGYLMF